jgi:hypothetical protein
LVREPHEDLKMANEAAPMRCPWGDVAPGLTAAWSRRPLLIACTGF